MDLFDKVQQFKQADEFRAMGLFPYFRELQSRQDTEVIMEGKRRIMLGSNNYLGLTVQPEIIEAGIRALRDYGTGCSGSRLLNGTLVLHREFEEKLSAFLGKDDVATFPAGFQGNLGAISALVGRGDYMICDRENHASIYAGCKLSYGTMLRYKHNDMAELEKRLRSVPESAGCLIITDGVFSMSGDIANLPEICDLARKYGARVMVDDAHGFGILGSGGRGTADRFGLTKEVDVITGTFSKSLASLGGFAAADAKVIDFIRCNSRPYIFAASIPPASIAVATAALEYLQAHPELPQRLLDLTAYMRQKLNENGIKTIDNQVPIIPIYTYEPIPTLTMQKELYERGVYVNATIPPACPPGGCLLRCSLMATLTHELIDEAVGIIAEVFHENGL
ncbi:MAG: pyridoxal phosphate-dependent aminotransferase family protein [Oscillospiraceae bacterium]|nr:pyridoxal phosphate-dependent aminotransferase family protein [Oscillospiraceae bacterium]